MFICLQPCLYMPYSNSKTQCALELCWRVRLKRSNINIFWVSGKKEHFPNDYSSIACAIEPNIKRHGTVEFLELVKTFLESGKEEISPWILVVDGVDMKDFRYFSLLPRGGGKILFTSRTNDLPVQSTAYFDSIHLGNMTPSEATQMLLTLSSGTNKLEKTACQKLVCALDYSPATVARAAAFLYHAKLSEAPISTYLSGYMDWNQTQSELLSAPQDKTEGETEYQSEMDGTIPITFNHLLENEPTAAALLQVLSCLDPYGIEFSLLYLKDKIDQLPHVRTFFDERILSLCMCEADLLEALDCLVRFCLIMRSPNGKNYQLQHEVRKATLSYIRGDKNSGSFTDAVLLVSLKSMVLSTDATNTFTCLLPHILELTSLRHELCPEVSKCLLLQIRLYAIEGLRLQGRAPEAAAMGQEAIGRELVRLGTSPGTDLLTLAWYHALSMSLYDIDMFEQARITGDFAYQNRLRMFGEGNIDTLRSLAHLGWVELSSSGDVPKAIETFEEILSQIEKDDTLRSLEVDARRGLVIAFGRVGNLDEALANQLKVLELEKSIHGEDSTEYLLVLLDASSFYYMKLGEHQKAGTILEDILPRLTNVLGPAHHQILVGFSRLGYYYLNYNLAMIGQAEAIFRGLVNTEATSILRAGLDPMEMCDGLADVLKAKGTPESLEEAIHLAEGVVNGFTNHRGQDHPRTKKAVQDLDDVRRLWEATKSQEPSHAAIHNEDIKYSSKSLTSSSYQYDPLPRSSAYRLLQYEVKNAAIHCSLHMVDKASTNGYVALSYTWGSARPGDGLTADPICKIFCDGKELYITQNLFDALSVLRMAPNTLLWVDAICINQKDLDERSSQVALMGTIYSRAVYTIVWLGKPDVCSNVVHGLLQKITGTVNWLLEEQGIEGLPQDPTASTFWVKVGRPPFSPWEQRALVNFFDRLWFERCWIMQEIILAKGAFCVCGGAEFNWSSLYNMCVFLHRSGWIPRLSRMKGSASTLRGGPLVGAKPIMLMGLTIQCTQGLPVSSMEVLAPATQLREDEIEPGFYRVLQHLVGVTRTSNATLALDKVFAPVALALHLFSGVLKPDFFAISYRGTAEEAYTRVSGLIIQHTQSLSLLGAVEDRKYRQMLNLPSWVPDFSAHFVQSLDREQSSFDCSAGLKLPCKPKIYHSTLKIQGIHVDTIGKCGPSREESSIEGQPSLWLGFLLQLDRTYVTGESSLKAFSRTLIAGQRIYKTDDELLEIYHRYLL
jgi:tetratricopeptide (TPR) repeat protein